MAEKEKTEKFTYEKATFLLEKLNPLVNNCEMKSGFIVNKFSILPFEFVKNNNVIDWYKVWGFKYYFQRKINPELDYVIVAIHRPGYSTFVIDLKIKRYIDIIDLDE